LSQAWYIQHNGRAVGPVTAAKLKQLASAAKIGPETKLRLGDDGEWLDAERVKGLFPATRNSGATPPQQQPGSQVAPGRSGESPPTQDASPRTSRGQTDSALPYEPPVSVDHPDAIGTTQSSIHSENGLGEAFRAIWFKPRQTIRWLIAERPGRDAIIIAMIAFGLQFIDNGLLTNEDSLVDSSIILAPIGVPISACIGVMILYVFGFMHKFVGEAIGGNGDYRSLRTAFAWSLVPTIFSLPISLLLLFAIMLVPSILNLPNWLLNLPFTILLLWGLVIEVGGISAAHEFSIWRALITFVVSLILLTLALLIVVQAAVMLTI
jgi:hypothetical protein